MLNILLASISKYDWVYTEQSRMMVVETITQAGENVGSFTDNKNKNTNQV